MDENCPECGNEIYKPYTYCNACGWEKEEEKPAGKAKKEKPHPEKKSEKETKEKPKKPIKIKCKCGEMIKIKSSKQPVKIECPNCGRKGTLKAPAKSEASDDEEPEPTEPPEKPEKRRPASERVGGKPPKRRPIPGTDESHRRKIPRSKKKERKRLEPEDLSEKYCPECDTRLSVTGSCPNCGYRGRGRGRAAEFIGEPWAEDESSRGHSYKRPQDAHMVKPKKGICSQCGSKNLRFYDDGSGRCGSCGRHFRWDGGPSRVQEDVYMCNNCGEQLEYIKEYDRWYCHQCDAYK